MTVKEIGENTGFRDMAKPQFVRDTEDEVIELEEQYQRKSIRFGRGLLYSHRELNDAEVKPIK